MTKADRIKMGLCGVLAGIAVVMAVSAVTDIGSRASAAGDGGSIYEQQSESAVYVLRDWDGNVGIFTESSGKKPATVTNIQTAALPEADRALLVEGVAVYGWQELQKLLEDLGS